MYRGKINITDTSAGPANNVRTLYNIILIITGSLAAAVVRILTFGHYPSTATATARATTTTTFRILYCQWPTDALYTITYESVTQRPGIYWTVLFYIRRRYLYNTSYYIPVRRYTSYTYRGAIIIICSPRLPASRCRDALYNNAYINT